LYSHIYRPRGSLQYIVHIIHILPCLHGISRLGLDPNPSRRRRFSCSRAAPREIKIDLRRGPRPPRMRRGSLRSAPPSSSTRSRKVVPLPVAMVAPFAVVAMAPPWAAAASASSSPAPRRPSPPLPHLPLTSPHPAATAARPAQSAACAAAEGEEPLPESHVHCAAAGGEQPDYAVGQMGRASLGVVAARPQRRPPSPALSPPRRHRRASGAEASLGLVPSFSPASLCLDRWKR
jgi:hypothetical protein